jgi:hypothetical protein
MCHHGRGRFGFAGQNDMCGCSCTCPATTTIGEEIRLLEEHKKHMQDRLGEIDNKITSLKTTKES